MKKDYREQIYRLGVPVRVREIESELAGYHADFPELFLSETVPQLLRPERRNGASSNGTAPTEKEKTGGGASQVTRERRERTSELLAWMSQKPRTVADIRRQGFDLRGMHQLVRYGYLKERDGVYTRTRKQLDVGKVRGEEKRTKRTTTKKKVSATYYHADNVRERRAKSAELINGFDLTTPKPPPAEAMRKMGSYVRRGYLKQRGRGLYVRTNKTYEVDA